MRGCAELGSGGMVIDVPRTATPEEEEEEEEEDVTFELPLLPLAPPPLVLPHNAASETVPSPPTAVFARLALMPASRLRKFGSVSEVDTSVPPPSLPSESPSDPLESILRSRPPT